MVIHALPRALEPRAASHGDPRAPTRSGTILPVCRRASRAPTRLLDDPRAATRRKVFPRAGNVRQHSHALPRALGPSGA
jgi:hypothetical protein